MKMNHNANKYYLPESKELSESQKLELAKALLELERQGVLQYHDGRWHLTAGVEIEETPNGPLAHIPNEEEGTN